MDVHDPVYDGNLPVLYLEDHHLACPERLVAVIEEQNVAALEGRLHRTTAKPIIDRCIRIHRAGRGRAQFHYYAYIVRPFTTYLRIPFETEDGGSYPLAI